MSARSTISIAALAFAAGWVSATNLATNQPSSQGSGQSSGQTTASAPSVSASVSVGTPVAPSSISRAAIATTSASKVTPVLPSGPNHVVDPDRDGPSESDAEDRLLNLIRDRFPQAKVFIRKANPDGTFASRETLGDGSAISRNFNTQGQMVEEDWRQSIGDEVIRTYFDSGSIKEFWLKRTDGSTTTIAFSESGLFKARTDDLADGTEVTTSYNAQGLALERWRKDKDGKSVRF